jgi:hypothetical protein
MKNRLMANDDCSVAPWERQSQIEAIFDSYIVIW